MTLADGAWSWLRPPPGGLTIAAMGVALVVDRLWGEPPARWHPVVWMGRALDWAGCRAAPVPAAAPLGFDLRAWSLGFASWWALALLCMGLAVLTQAGLLASEAHPVVQALVLGLLLKPLFAWRMLNDEVQAVELALQQSLAHGRERLSWLVSRDVSQLSAEQVRESAIESLAENFNDSVVAPLCWFMVAGLPGAALFRLANTADAMWGYPGERNGRVWTWAGQWAARADDALGWLPARLTACWLWPAALYPRGGFANFRQLAKEARRTPSPNSGWPMAAVALRLGVRLGKPGVYVLNANGQVPDSGVVLNTLNLSQKKALSLILIGVFALVFGYFFAN